MHKILLSFIAVSLILASCGRQPEDGTVPAAKGEAPMQNIEQETINSVTDKLIKKYGDDYKFRAERGVAQVASLWRESDGDASEFEKFCMEKFIDDDELLHKTFLRISENFESINGNYNSIILKLKKPLHLRGYDMLPIDHMFGAWDPSSHLAEDYYANKLAFYIALNFPAYSLEEKAEMGPEWSRKDWAYARVGDLFTARVPADVQQQIAKVMTEADTYISNYNIYVGFLADDDGNTYFPKDLKLITHWNLRDELKSQYGREGGLERQEMIYQVMQRIIDQSIPQEVINSNEFMWNPYKNKIIKEGVEQDGTAEPDTRYEFLLRNFQARRAVDKYNQQYPTYIQRKFSEDMEIPQEKVEKLFVELCSSPTVEKVADLIKERLGRDLRPFDIWYDGFKARSGIDEDKLNKITRNKYPTTEAFEKDIPNILTKLGFSHSKATEISKHISVDASSGAGHAWGAEMKSQDSRLRSRISDKGMDYKGYNIGIHELGHNVEQTITLHDVDYYMLNGVPNTAFTEAWAFAFQKRDLELLGIESDNPNKDDLYALDNFWSTYEIMGVSLVDMRVWKWLYENPDADEAKLKAAVIRIAKEVWNSYYAPVFGIEDSPILAIYSHMIDYPLYLSAYPIGHLIELQIDNYIQDKNLGAEMIRMCKQGTIIPQLWMEGAVGNGISIEPTIDAAEDALNNMK
jgi:hypothetical protein